MKQLFTLFLFVVGFFISFGQCPGSSVNLLTQEDVDNFIIEYPNCTEFSHSITVGTLNTDIDNLNGLSNLRIIHNLSIGSDLLTSFSGLEGLETITGKLTISGNHNIENFQGLGVTSILNGFSIWRNDSLTSLQGLEGLEYLGGWLDIHLTSLTNLSGLENLTEIDGYLIIESNPQLNSLQGLNNLESIDEHLVIAENPLITNFEGLENLQTINHVFGIWGNEGLENFEGLENLQTISKELEIKYNTNLSSLNGLESLTTIGGNIKINNNNSLNSIDALSNINAELIGTDNYFSWNNIWIFENPQLSFCSIQSVCDALIIPEKTISIFNNAIGCDSVAEVENQCGNLSIDEFMMSKEIEIYPNPVENVIHVKTDLEIKNLQMFDGSGKLLLSEPNTNIVDVSHLPNGIYLVKVKTEKGNYSAKLIKR